MTTTVKKMLISKSVVGLRIVLLLLLPAAPEDLEEDRTTPDADTDTGAVGVRRRESVEEEEEEEDVEGNAESV